MQIEEIQIRNAVESSEELSQLLLENLKTTVLMKCPKLMHNTKKIFVKELSLDTVEAEIDKINSFAKPWIKMLSISKVKSLSALNKFLGNVKKPLRYLFIEE